MKRLLAIRRPFRRFAEPGKALRGACAVAAAAFVLSTRPAAGQLSLGHLKSLYIERFTRFIEWPADSLPRDRPFVLCILGSGDTATDLARVAPARPFKDRTCEVRRLQPGSDLQACHLIYMAGSERGRLIQLLGTVDGKPILTVSDSSGFAERGVLINLLQEGRYLRFEINLTAVKRSKLVFSSQLLRLARPVGGPGAAGPPSPVSPGSAPAPAPAPPAARVAPDSGAVP